MHPLQLSLSFLLLLGLSLASKDCYWAHPVGHHEPCTEKLGFKLSAPMGGCRSQQQRSWCITRPDEEGHYSEEVTKCGEECVKGEYEIGRSACKKNEKGQDMWCCCPR
ncbi:hypothetical protein L596_020436 [Steinernema carpocapsae]|uniref:Single domain-containing protein n=1 Tax=Steinernema carpocapsae TaxID=34508 RepID=A0A4V6A0W5_STECR|nr:hypothetical protein L596_020436 [Steinernema carpocapsae]